MSEVDVSSAVPVVFDQGSGTFKAGIAGSESPKVQFSSYVGYPKHLRVMAAAAEGDVFVGDKATQYRGLLRLSYPMSAGCVRNWDELELLYKHALSSLQCAADAQPILLTENALNPRSNRVKCTQLLFERFQVPALHWQNPAILSLYASGRTTGLVCDIGDTCTQIVPVVEGFAMPLAIERTDVGGRDITNLLTLLLRKAGFALLITTFMTHSIFSIFSPSFFPLSLALSIPASSFHHHQISKSPRGSKRRCVQLRSIQCCLIKRELMRQSFTHFPMASRFVLVQSCIVHQNCSSHHRRTL